MERKEDTYIDVQIIKWCTMLGTEVECHICTDYRLILSQGSPHFKNQIQDGSRFIFS